MSDRDSNRQRNRVATVPLLRPREYLVVDHPRRSLTGDLQDISSTELDEVKQQLANLYTQAGVNSNTEVTVALYQLMEASMNVSSSLSDAAVCQVFIEALTFDDFNATCTATVSGSKYTFALKYPLEPAASVAAKTAQTKSFVVTSNFTDAMAAAAANLRRRRLDTLSVVSVDPPTTSVDAQVTIVVSVLGSDPNAYATLQNQSSAVQAQASSVDASTISTTLLAAVANLTGLVVTAPTQTVVETNAPPTTPPPLAPPSLPKPPPGQPQSLPLRLPPVSPSPAVPSPSSPPLPPPPPPQEQPLPPKSPPPLTPPLPQFPPVNATVDTIENQPSIGTALAAGIAVIAGFALLAVVGTLLFIRYSRRLQKDHQEDVLQWTTLPPPRASSAELDRALVMAAAANQLADIRITFGASSSASASSLRPLSSPPPLAPHLQLPTQSCAHMPKGGKPAVVAAQKWLAKAVHKAQSPTVHWFVKPVHKAQAPTDAEPEAVPPCRSSKALSSASTEYDSIPHASSQDASSPDASSTSPLSSEVEEASLLSLYKGADADADAASTAPLTTTPEPKMLSAKALGKQPVAHEPGLRAPAEVAPPTYFDMPDTPDSRDRTPLPPKAEEVPVLNNDPATKAKPQGDLLHRI